MAPYERHDVLQALAAGVEARSETFAALLVQEAGKPITDARIEVERAVAVLRHGAGEALVKLDLTHIASGFAGTDSNIFLCVFNKVGCCANLE